MELKQNDAYIISPVIKEVPNIAYGIVNEEYKVSAEPVYEEILDVKGKRKIVQIEPQYEDVVL